MDTTNRLYEAMFLVDPAEAAQDWDGIVALIEGVLKRAGAQIICLRKWAERRLAYEIQHRSRGTYLQGYFRVDGRKISQIERDLRLSERIMRTLILLAEDRPAEVVERDMASVPADNEPQEDFGPKATRPQLEDSGQAEPEDDEDAAEEAGQEEQSPDSVASED